MHGNAKYLLWDFDNTLALRPGYWSQCLADVVNRGYPEKKALCEAFRPHLMSDFPRHGHETSHTHLSTSDEWWRALAPTLEQALRLAQHSSRIRPRIWQPTFATRIWIRARGWYSMTPWRRSQCDASFPNLLEAARFITRRS
jgi:hypothetical protein